MTPTFCITFEVRQSFLLFDALLIKNNVYLLCQKMDLNNLKIFRLLNQLFCCFVI